MARANFGGPAGQFFKSTRTRTLTDACRLPFQDKLRSGSKLIEAQTLGRGPPTAVCRYLYHVHTQSEISCIMLYKECLKCVDIEPLSEQDIIFDFYVNLLNKKYYGNNIIYIIFIF